jgi:hypothetical protein
MKMRNAVAKDSDRHFLRAGDGAMVALSKTLGASRDE